MSIIFNFMKAIWYNDNYFKQKDKLYITADLNLIDIKLQAYFG